MLKLSTLHTYLNQVLDLPCLHTAILLTPTGQLISYASDPTRSKEDIRSVVGLSGDSFLEVEEQGFAIFEIKGKPHLGSIYVQAINEEDSSQDNWQPLMLLVLNFTNGYDQEVVRLKAKALATHLAKSLSKYRDYLIFPRPPPTSSNISSPTPIR
ncbi:hypothetical protein EV361DRAFT_5274 [Lentinula raphanica]|uniref:Uncharacterized protein n=1 Tax=Lentinula raphanica TaxID=153919 RepID=A0AA38PMX8_9AGAR|nr:hypothetical protein C8R42DRAFT_721488 [Lentinula raphanica]KAJ3762189.1 hypothetical protein EV360DRAFT_79546 [Lentinula raphanica]KAJ3773700.1 hypothetical protein FB446DRAFT_517333 [Lentinula raphanica]KAJ3830285.1 hypothetical protein F5880DRAFT_1152224 [Lentinula raphanica]KAJ3845545.1 hypothetical protein F5878DRAFT_654906 [Lentinula raphanica]